MQKNLRPARDKKKNIQTGILMGQNTNIFSQLSATFLQNKASNTEEEQQFLKNTQIIEYHDPNINRIISLLRKKADITKGKAVLELKEAVSAMDEQRVQEFAPTFAQLYLEVIMNQSSKQVVDQFILIASDLLGRFKRVMIKEINTLYGPLLLSFKLNKLAGLLFTGNQAEALGKALVLLLKKETRKKFTVVVRLILECDNNEKVALAQTQRNCISLMRVLKEFTRIFQRSQKAKQLQPDFLSLLSDINEALHHKSFEDYFKIGGKAKGSILDFQTSLVGLYSRHPDWKIQWQYHAKSVSSNFLDKDPLVQQTLWKNCNRNMIESLSNIERNQKEENAEDNSNLLNIYLPKSEEKVLAVLKVGGLMMYKELHHYLQVFPSTTFIPKQTHKTIINKLTFQRKFLTALLQQQDENQSRAQCYFNISKLLLTRLRSLDLSEFDEKKLKQIRSLSTKFERQVAQNLQERFYSDPPASKNSFTFYVPRFFACLVNELKPAFQLKFHPQLTFKLYEQVQFGAESEKLLSDIYSKCQGNLEFLLKYNEIFPPKAIQLDMSEDNKQIQVSSKLFLLTHTEKEEESWFGDDWDMRKSIIVYDPRITIRDLSMDEDEQAGILSFRPLSKVLPSKLYDKTNLDSIKFNFFIKVIQNPEEFHSAKYLLPMTNETILPRNHKFVNRLLELYAEKSKKLKQGKWYIGEHQISMLRIISFLIIEQISRQKNIDNLQQNLIKTFVQNYCDFVRAISNYKMDSQAEDLLKYFSTLLLFDNLKQDIFQSSRKAILIVCEGLLKGGEGQQQKIRKNRLIRSVELINKFLWYCFSRSSTDGHKKLAHQFISSQFNWKNATVRAQPWLLLHVFTSKLQSSQLTELAKHILESTSNHHFILLVLNSEGLLPLQSHLEVRQLFVNLRKSIEQVLLKSSSEQLKQRLKVIIKELFSQGNVQLSEGVKNIISFLLLENQGDGDFINLIGDLCFLYPFEEFIKEERSVSRSLIYIDINLVIPLRKVNRVEEVYLSLLEKSQSAQGLKYFEILSILCVLWNKGVGIEEVTPTLPAILQKTTTNFNHHSSTVSPLTRNYSTYTLFTLINVVVSQVDRQILSKYQNFISQQLWRQISQGSQLHGLTQAARMRYATRSILTAKPQIAQRMIAEIPKIGLREFKFYSELLLQIEDDNEEQLPHHQHIFILFQELAQFLIRSIAHLSPIQKPEEEIVLELLQCPFPSLKKAAFLLLKAIYAMKIVACQPPKVYRELLKFQIKPDEQISTSLVSKVSTYMYIWQSLLLRREATERVEGQQISLSLEEYIQNQGFSDLLIKNCFVILQDKLDYLRNEGEYPILPQDLLNSDLEVVVDEIGWEHRLFKMTLQTLFLYIINFPIFLRGFMDFNKKYKNICDRLLRTVISEAIFRQQVAKIQLHEHKWKADGNFQIFVTKKNKQIYAEYTHDVIRIGLRLVMRGNYPLTPIDIEFGQGLKIQQGSRWGLMLQSQLHNRNNTIINGILLWKDNIDKKLSGVEQCAICFDIVNSNGQLPKKACKTCRKKFHGNCIMKWFTKSNKSQCPLCKSQFL